MDISIVIVSWNDQVHLKECLASLDSAPASRELEVIVVDNASADGSPEMVEKEFPKVKLILNQQNLGFARANNLGVTASRGKYVVLLNSDTKVLAGCTDALADYMDQNPKIGMLGPRILNADLTHQSSCRQFPNLWNNFCTATGLATLFPRTRLFSGEHMFYFRGDRAIDVDVLVGCFWMVRREAMREFGLLDEGFFMYGEDVDWCKRCWQAGWRVAFYPGGQAIHYRGGSSTKQNPVWVELTQQRSVLRYWEKHHGKPGQIGVRATLGVHRVVRCASALVTYVLEPSNRKRSRAGMEMNWACALDLWPKRCRQALHGVDETETAEAVLDG